MVYVVKGMTKVKIFGKFPKIRSKGQGQSKQKKGIVAKDIIRNTCMCTCCI
jgi:hypothetical protein